MTPRAWLVGVVLITTLCTLGYATRVVAQLIGQVGGAMPLAVFAVLIALVLLGNPLLGRLRAGWVFSKAVLAVVAALGLSVCAFTGSGFFRYFGGLTVIPSHPEKTQVDWRSTGVMAYVPGSRGPIAPGQVADPAAAARRVVDAGDKAAGAEVLAAVWGAGDAEHRAQWRRVMDGVEVGAAARVRVALLLTRAMHADANVTRAALDDALAPGLTPAPRGRGVLLNDGVYDPALMDGWLFGHPEATRPRVRDVPWSAWLPVFGTWGGAMMLLTVAAVGLAVVVRPQWSEHERLAFPIVRFTQLLVDRAPGDPLPRVARQRLFWLGLGVVLVHLVNGLNAWSPQLPRIRLTLDLGGLNQLFPFIGRSWQGMGILYPTIYPSIIAFSFLLPTAVSLTFGVTNLVFLLAAGTMIAHGVAVSDPSLGAGFEMLLSFGAMLGLAVMTGVTGRAYYGRVLAAALLPGRASMAPTATRWALRAALLATALAVVHLSVRTGSTVAAVLGVGVVLLTWLATARIVAETGLYRLGIPFVPVSLALALLGPEALAPTQVMLLAMIGVLLAGELWETPLAYALTGLELGRRCGVRVGPLACSWAATATLGLVLAAGAVLTVQYHYGVLGRDEGPAERRNTAPQVSASRLASELAATDALAANVAAGEGERLLRARPDAWGTGWVLTGAALFVLCAGARLRWAWWPIHPLMFVLLGNWGVVTLGPSFLLGWAVKALVVNVGGAAMYHRVLPLMVGVILGGLVGPVLWLATGAVVFALTGQPPPPYPGL